MSPEPDRRLPENHFRERLAAGRAQIGLWCSLASPYAAEVVAGSGFDWLLLDTEHAPSGLETVLAQLQAVAAYPTSAVVRPPSNDPVAIKRLLDLGAQSLLVPYVETASAARAAVAATRYPPTGIRGVAALTRASRFGRVADYGRRAADELCVLVQVETARSLDQLEAIAATDGVDGVFIGPADLGASLGHVGDPQHPEVAEAVEAALRRVVSAGTPAGILTGDPAAAERYVALGASFVAVGSDIGVLARETERLAGRFAGTRPT